MRDIKIQILWAIIALLLTPVVTYASSPSTFEINFKFPSQPARIGESSVVSINIKDAELWRSGSAVLQVSGVTFVNPNSDTSQILVPTRMSLTSGRSSQIAEVPITVRKDGEYEIRVTITLETRQGYSVRSRSIGVVAENGLVWFGRDNVDHAIEEKVRRSIRADPTLDAESARRFFNERLRSEQKRRAKKSARHSKLIDSTSKSVRLGLSVTLEASWIGPGSGNLGTGSGDTNFPMHGVRVTLSDKASPPSPDITGYVIDGIFTFTPPTSNYSYRVTLETEFPGIKSDGSIEIAGGGIGAFRVLQQTAIGTTFICEAEDTLHVLCDSSTTGASAASAAWSAFHGIGEMVLQSKKQLGIDKRLNFKVIFNGPSMNSFFDGQSIFISYEHRYEWDVIAHEFGHAIAAESGSINTNTGGAHDGSNQYDYMPNTTTFQRKAPSLELAVNEGFGTWFGTALMQNPSPAYNGRFRGISDNRYDDASQSASANLEQNTARLLSTVAAAYGEDTEVAVLHLLWDIADSNNEMNSRAICANCADGLSLGLNGLWAVLNGSQVENVIDLYRRILERRFNSDVSSFFNTGENGIDKVGLQGALDLSYSFSEFGVAPHLEQPPQKTKIDLLRDTTGPRFVWSQKKTGTLEGLTEFTLALYTSDLGTLIFRKSGITANEYTLNQQDIQEVKGNVDSLSKVPGALIAVIVGENDYLLELESGPYLSNPIELMINNVDRTLIVVVDSSGSNTTTDPSNLRVRAARETLRSLNSVVEAMQDNTVPDLAGAIDFDTQATILSELDDPDAVLSRLSSIDSSGGTDIAAGIHAAVGVLDNLNTGGLLGVLADKSAIVVFTDGENGAGPIPVIQAIVSASARGIRVHLGFLNPIVSGRRGPVPSDMPPGYVVPTPGTLDSGPPSTIEEAVLASGGTYAVIGSAESQVAFVTQMEQRGFTNSDKGDAGGQSVVGLTTTFEILNDALASRSFRFLGRSGEEVTLRVDAQGNFQPFLKLIDRSGALIGAANDPDLDGVAQLLVTLPYTGEYVAEITSEDQRTGLFSFFVDVSDVIEQQVEPIEIPMMTMLGRILLTLVLLGAAGMVWNRR